MCCEPTTEWIQRAFTQEKAESYGLTGFVKNTADGKVRQTWFLDLPLYGENRIQTKYSQVEGEAQGDEESLQKFVKDINEGPKHAHVVKVERSTIDIKDGESSFER